MIKWVQCLPRSPKSRLQPDAVAVSAPSWACCARAWPCFLRDPLAVRGRMWLASDGGDRLSLVQGPAQVRPVAAAPRITVATTAALPGKLIVYVDGVMACLDDASRVDQIVSAGRRPQQVAT